MISQTKNIIEDYRLLIQKSIIKPRQKNQFTKDNRFFDTFQKKKKKIIKRELLVIQIGIPKTLQNNNVFRLNSNIQFPRNAESCYQLGNLNVDFYSYNYKINRIDRSRHITLITYDPIDRPFIPMETVQEMMQNNDQRLLKSFNELNEKKLQFAKSEYLQINKNLSFSQNFENSILNKSFIGIIQQKFSFPTISKVESDKIVTLHRIVNDSYLACLGIDYEMLTHFGQETGTIPIPFFFAHNDYNSQHLSNFFILNTLNQKVHEMQATNYRGEQFPAKIIFHNFNYYDEGILYEYLYFIWEVDKRWCSKQNVLENHKDYFNLKEIPTTTSLNIQVVPDDEKRCGFKQIYPNF